MEKDASESGDRKIATPETSFILRLHNYLDRISEAAINWWKHSHIMMLLLRAGLLATNLSVLFGAVLYLLEASERSKQRYYQAWQTINLAQFNPADGGRGKAIKDLVEDGYHLTGQSFDGVNLIGAYFHGGILNRVTFLGSDLSEAEFVCGHSLSDYALSIFHTSCRSPASLNNVDFSKATLSNTHFTGAIIKAARFDELAWNRPRKCSLISQLSCVVPEKDYVLADFSYTEMSDTEFIDVKARGMSFDHASLKFVRLLDLEVLPKSLSFRFAHLDSVVFKIIGRPFPEIDLTNATLSNVMVVDSSADENEKNDREKFEISPDGDFVFSRDYSSKSAIKRTDLRFRFCNTTVDGQTWSEAYCAAPKE